MANNIKIYTSIAVFGIKNKLPYIVCDSDKNIPTWEMTNSEKQSLDLVRDGFYNISGVSPVFYGHVEQNGVFEFWDGKYKQIYILYSVYFPEIFDLSNKTYLWTEITGLDQDSKFSKMIRYIYRSRL